MPYFRKIRVKHILYLALFLFLFSVNVSNAESNKSVDFYIDSSYDTRGRNNLTATNHITGLNAYYFVDDFYWDSLDPQSQNILINNIVVLSNEFDNAIYPKMHQFYGEEWIPGIDNDRKIYILLTDIIKNAGGYYNPNDEYFKNQIKDNRSNEKEIIYFNVNYIDNPSAKPFIAHEFQHMISWNQKKRILNLEEDVWLNEALSEYSSTALGYDNILGESILKSRVDNFIKNPSDSLTEWKNENKDYSNVNLFMQFLIGRYGNNMIKLIISSSKIGIGSINDALQKIDPKENFSNVFSDWVVANYFNGQTIQNKKYGYANENLSYDNLHISPTSSFMVYANSKAKSSFAKGEENIKDWTGKWYQFISSPVLSMPNQTLKIDFAINADDANFQIPCVINNTDGVLFLKNYTINNNREGSIYIENFGTTVSSATIMPFGAKKTFGFTDSETPVIFSYSASLISPNQTTIKSISPNASSFGNRILVAITGENFLEGSTVNFGDMPAGEINFIDSKIIIAKAPLFYQDKAVDVSIINPDSTKVTLPRAFSYRSDMQDGALIRAEKDYKVYVIKGKYRRWIQSEKIFAFYNFKWSDVKLVTPEMRDYYETSALIRADKDYKVYETAKDNKKQHLLMSAEKFELSGRKWNMIFIVNDLEKSFYKTSAPITK